MLIFVILPQLRLSTGTTMHTELQTVPWSGIVGVSEQIRIQVLAVAHFWHSQYFDLKVKNRSVTTAAKSPSLKGYKKLNILYFMYIFHTRNVLANPHYFASILLAVYCSIGCRWKILREDKIQDKRKCPSHIRKFIFKKGMQTMEIQ